MPANVDCFKTEFGGEEKFLVGWCKIGIYKKDY